MELSLKYIAPLCAAILLFSGCKTTKHAIEGRPIRTIENPYDEAEYQKMSDSFVREMELWRKDPEAVTQIEIYKLEGKNAVILDRKDLEVQKQHHVTQVTTRKYIYVFYLDLPQYIQQAWWVSRTEIYSLPSQRPEDNPALQQPPVPLREASTLTPVEDHSQDPAPPDWQTLP